ncbi:MAG: ABC transporter permease [Aeoliella sp.]
MKLLRLVWKEIRYRWGSALLAMSGVALAVAACIALLAVHTAANRETRRLQRDIGFNLRIIPREASVESFLLDGYAKETMPEEIVERLSKHKTVAYNHLVAMLQEPIEIAGGPVVLTGLSPTYFPPGKKKPPMSPTIEPGTAHVGHLIGKRLGAKKGDTIDIREQSFTVARVAPEAGTSDDLRVWVHLSDAQKLLDKPDQVNEIRAIDCLCLAADESPQELLRKEIAKVAPEAQVAMLTQIASARAKQRQMMERLVATALPALVVSAALLVGILAFVNIRQRKQEIGILRAVGYQSGSIAALVLGKALLIGLIGAAVGCLAGAIAAWSYVPQVAMLTGAKFQLESDWFVTAMLVAPLVACVASLMAASLAVIQHPADVLREQ